VTDRLTGLIWLRNADCFGLRTWDDALSVSNNLADGQCGLTDGSEPGDWRLSNRNELQSLLHIGHSDPALPNTEGTGQWTDGDPFTGVVSGSYWSSSSIEDILDFSWVVDFRSGYVLNQNKTNDLRVWPVRGRQAIE